MTATPNQPMTVDDFIAWEHRQETRHEFSAGAISDFAGGTLGHAGLIAGLLERIRPHVRPCRTFSSDALVRSAAASRYPDLVVTCDPRDANDGTFVSYPKLIVEVLSESTAPIDRGEKLDEYRSIESLEEYLLVDSRKHWAMTLRRSNDTWIVAQPVTSGTVHLASIDLDLDLDALYAECGL